MNVLKYSERIYFTERSLFVIILTCNNKATTSKNKK